MDPKIIYKDKVCLFLDILGFSQHVNETTDKLGNEVEEKVLEISELLFSLPVKFKSFGSYETRRNVTQFSDSIVVSFDLSDKNAFITLLDDIMLIIVNFIMKGYLVRGGISYGKLFHDENIVFGPAMIAAYELESKIAIYPRVIFDKELVDELINNGDSALKSIMISEVKSTYLWKEDFDGKYYLNFLKGPEIFLDPKEYFSLFLPTLRKFITTALNNRSAQAVRIKYGWLKTKFNELIQDLEDSKNDSYRLPKKIK